MALQPKHDAQAKFTSSNLQWCTTNRVCVSIKSDPTTLCRNAGLGPPPSRGNGEPSFQVARKCRKVSFSTPCDVAASGTNPWAQRQAISHHKWTNPASVCQSFKFVVLKVNSMDSPNSSVDLLKNSVSSVKQLLNLSWASHTSIGTPNSGWFLTSQKNLFKIPNRNPSFKNLGLPVLLQHLFRGISFFEMVDLFDKTRRFEI